MSFPVICPVCKKPLVFREKTAVCENGHSFDRSKEGSVNLILNGSASAGDDPVMIAARKRFLEKGHYDHLLFAMKEAMKDRVFSGAVAADACCGEGYYTNALQAAFPEVSFYGFDLSKRALRYAAKEAEKALFFAANISSVPISDLSVNILIHVFAPVNEKEFLRILAPDGVLIHVFPGKDHLMGIKRALYASARQNDEDSGISDAFEKVSGEKVTKILSLDNESLRDLITMTPYFYRTPKDSLEKALALPRLETETDFIINVYRKKREE
jgi:23S rRNA (guanine745-N1)-methyltransferase